MFLFGVVSNHKIDSVIGLRNLQIKIVVCKDPVGFR